MLYCVTSSEMSGAVLVVLEHLLEWEKERKTHMINIV